MTTPTNCPACGNKIKDGLFGMNLLLEDAKADLIAEMNNTERNPGCTSCQGEAFVLAVTKFKTTHQKLLEEIDLEVENIPIVTIQSPLNWDYKVIGIATGQSTSGTGFLTEFASSWTDFFGAQSGAYNKKISGGEALCYKKIRTKALQMGGNAIIAVDIDYSEMGGAKAMVMVCVSGTVVKLSNPEIVSDLLKISLEKVAANLKQLEVWKDKYAAITANY